MNKNIPPGSSASVAERIKKHESRGGKGKLIPYQLEFESSKYKGGKEPFYTVGHGHRIYGQPKESYTQEEIDTVSYTHLTLPMILLV